MAEIEVGEQKLELSAGITTVLARMRTNPEEFFGSAEKWKFLFSENLQQVLTEVEKGALFEGFRAIRRQELDALVMATLLKDKNDKADDAGERLVNVSHPTPLGKWPTTSNTYQQNAQPLKGAKKWLP